MIPAADGGVSQQQVAASVGSNGSVLTLASIKAPKNGYVYIYISNQSNNDFYFDNLQAGIVQGNIAEENHYYAYGLKIATLSSKKLGDNYEGTLKNNYLYNGKEFFDDADLNWYDYGFRNYDPQIGRFTQLDPLTDSYPFLTPYQYASCDPITNIDIDGLEGKEAVKGIIGTVGKVATEAAEHGGAIKELGSIVVKASYAGSNAKKVFSLVLSAGNYLAMANVLVSIINSGTQSNQAGGVDIKNMKPLSNPTDYLGGPSFKLRMHGPPPSNDTKVIDIEKPIGIIGDVAELTERAAKTLGEGKLEKIAGNTGTFTTGVSVAMHLLKNDTKGLFTDAGELIISRTPAAPYYYGAKLLNAIRNSKSVLAETYMGIYGNLMEWVDEMHSLPPDKQNEKNKEWLRYRRQANHYSDVLDQLGQKWLDLYGPETE